MLYEILYWTYIISLSILTVYCFFQFRIYLSSRNNKKLDTKTMTEVELPNVTIQLPIYNEQYVVQRLIDRVCAINYPPELLQIQVVDDSDDITIDLIRNKVKHFQKKGINISHIHRENRSGFKAGALQHALDSAEGEFIAIFDADFLPRADFLFQTLPHFRAPNTAAVQTRWSHLNSDYSILTEMQAFHLNVHFNVEQSGRENADVYLQFNGTGGIWRKSSIIDAGGWSADTLTEDLDLSYRAQLNGWQIKYLRDIDSPAELPVEMQGLKSQQFRWMKGGAETARKLIPSLLTQNISLSKKIHAVVHLFSSSVFVLLLMGLISSVMLLFIFGSSLAIGLPMYAFSAGFLILGVVYYASNRNFSYNKNHSHQGTGTFLFKYPMFLSLSMGMALHNSIAVLEGYMKIKSPFIRTPKYAITSEGSFSQKLYRIHHLPISTYLEIILALFFSTAVIYGIYYNMFIFILFHLMAAIGFSVIAYYSVKHVLAK